ncbi:MAG: biopolymer transporter ExbD [Vampirovibrionales bacterium]|nr:biopolymer transporter ExbD [Vampirovibrionales bacterium]
MRGTKRPIFNEINITPLTDIFLVLLIIMMVVAPMLNTSGLKLSVPSVGPAPDVKEQPKVTRIKIDAKGNYTVGDNAVPAEQLLFEIKRLKPQAPDGVIIETDPTATHNALTVAMDAVQSADIQKLAVTSSKPIDEEGAP